MNLLLDTHVWLWMGLEPKRLGKKTRALLENSSSILALSVVSVWEILLKCERGKLQLPEQPAEYVRTRLPRSGASLLDLSLDHVLAVESLERLHADPFDRLLIAVALSENRTFVTADARLLDYPIVTVDART